MRSVVMFMLVHAVVRMLSDAIGMRWRFCAVHAAAL